MRSKHGIFQKNTKYNVRGEGQSYLCQECGYSTFSQSDFKKHESLSACSEARITVRRQGKTHMIPMEMEANGAIRKYKCNKCDYSTDYLSNVRVHVRAVHKPKTEVSAQIGLKPGQGLKFKCNQCDFDTIKADELKAHLSTFQH